jgi:hypothetical protein
MRDIMTTYTEDLHAGAFIASEGPGTRSRDSIVVVSGQNLKAGAVLGKVAHGTASSAAFAGNTGNGVLGAVTLGANVKSGVYKLVVLDPIANAGAFQVEGPDGIVIGTGKVATAFNAGGLSFTLADGATDFIAGDGFNITVAAGTGKYKAYDDTATDGSEVAAGILFNEVDATSADQPGVAVVRAAEVASAKLVWGAGQDSTMKANGLADLAILGIIAR